MTPAPYPIEPSILVNKLAQAGYPPQKVESMLEGRISYRALYRWRKKEAQPQRKQDYWAVHNLAEALGVLDLGVLSTVDDKSDDKVVLEPT
jgi:hypothetical protein